MQVKESKFSRAAAPSNLLSNLWFDRQLVGWFVGWLVGVVGVLFGVLVVVVLGLLLGSSVGWLVGVVGVVVVVFVVVVVGVLCCGACRLDRVQLRKKRFTPRRRTFSQTCGSIGSWLVD